MALSMEYNVAQMSAAASLGVTRIRAVQFSMIFSHLNLTEFAGWHLLC